MVGQRGGKDKLTLAVIDRLESLGCDPIEDMAKIAMDEEADPNLRAKVFKELAQYIAPKRKAVKMQADAASRW